MILFSNQINVWKYAREIEVTHFPCALGTTNLGDDIQSEACRIFFDLEPDHWCPRDDSTKWTGVVPLCGWFGRCPRPSTAQWVVVGFHLWREEGADFDALRRAVAEQGFPAGCRDTHTRDMLMRHGIEAVFGGCVTQTLLEKPKTPTLKIAVEADCPNDTWVSSTHRVHGLKHLHPLARLTIARSQLALLGAAEKVVTTKLHAYLPSLAMGCPVVKTPDGMKPVNPERWTGYLNDDVEARR